MPIHMCSNCGLPTSWWDDAGAPPAGWYCDGPNDNTTENGCFTLDLDPDEEQRHANLV